MLQLNEALTAVNALLPQWLCSVLLSVSIFMRAVFAWRRLKANGTQKLL